MAESRGPGFTVEWTFENGFLKSTSPRLHWYEFFLADLQNSAWCLCLSLRTDIICVYILRLSEGEEGSESLSIDCDFDLLLCQQEPDAPRSLRGSPPATVQKIGFKKEEVSEYVHIVPRTAIDALEEEAMLLLRCRIWPRDSSFLHPVRHWVRSSPGAYSEYFKWAVNDFSLLQKGDRKSYVLQRTKKDPCDLNLDLFLGDDEDSLWIKPTGPIMYCYISSVSVLDARRGKTLCLKDWYLYNGNGYIHIPLRVRKSKLLEEKEKFLPNDQLTLYFDVRRNAFEGVLYKVTVGDPVVDEDIAAPDTHNLLHTCASKDSVAQTDLTVDADIAAPDPQNILHTCASKDLYDLFKEGKLTDFELRIGSETIRAHKAILAARSPVLLDMLTNDLRESSHQGVAIEDLEVDTVQQLLEFMYLDSVPDLDGTSAMKLYSAASKYRVVGLKKKCSEILKSKLCVKNVCPILSVADTHSDDDLKQFVQEFISQNEGRILLSHEWENFLNENMPLASRVMLFLHKKRLETQ